MSDPNTFTNGSFIPFGGVISNAKYADWLEDSSAIRVILFRVSVVSGGFLTYRYMSKGYYSKGTIAPYLNIVAGGLKLTERISPTSEPTLSAGDLEIYNIGGEYDSWLDDIWTNCTMTAHLGDMTWGEADFRQIFTGVVASIDGSKQSDRLNIKFRNIMERLNWPLTEAKIGGTGPNADAIVPTALGECSNIPMPVSNDATLEFAWGNGDNEGVVEVRTDGKPRSAVTHSPTTGRTVFTEAVGTGQVTATVQGAKLNGVYVNNCADLVKLVVTTMGSVVANRFSLAELDTANFAQFAIDHPQPMGLWLNDRTNVVEAVKQLTASIGAQLLPSSLGLLKLIQFNVPTSATTELRQSQRIDNTISIAEHFDVSAAVSIGYDRNYTVQTNLQTGLPLAHKELYAIDYATAGDKDDVVKAAYKLDAAPVQENGCLKTKLDASAEATRRLTFRKVPRRTYRFEGTPGNIMLELGQSVKLFSNRYNLQNGKFGIVSSLTKDFGNLHVTVEVTV